MKIDAYYIALSIVNEVMRDAINKAHKGLEQCGGLDHPNTKITEEAKSYFRDQTREYKKAIPILQKIHKELSDELWDANQSNVEKPDEQR